MESPVEEVSSLSVQEVVVHPLIELSASTRHSGWTSVPVRRRRRRRGVTDTHTHTH